MPKTAIKKNDKVYVLTGKDHKKTGRVLRVIPQEGRVLVEKINQIFKHVRPNPQKNIKGGIVQKESPLQISNVMLVCPSCNQPTRIGRAPLPNGKFARCCKKCSHNID